MSAERMKGAAQTERANLFEENTTLLHEKNQAQLEKRRMEFRMKEIEEEKEEVSFFASNFLHLFL